MAEKMTYAQKFLYDLLTSRTLKIWCDEKEVPYLVCYKIACGKSVPTYSAICQLLPYIPVTDWFYYENEEIPFKRRTLKEWDSNTISSFVRRHKHDYLEMGKRYGTTETYARNLFVNDRAKPTVNLIRAAALDGIDPAEFFTAGDSTDDGKFYPDRGDIVSLFGKTILVLSKEKQNRLTHSLTGVTLVEGKPDLLSLATVTYVRNIPELLEKASDELLEGVLKEIKALFR